jgi:hypothetical protein
MNILFFDKKPTTHFLLYSNLYFTIIYCTFKNQYKQNIQNIANIVKPTHILIIIINNVYGNKLW